MVVLATKCYVEGDARERALDSLDSLVANDLADLDASWARNLLAEEWGAVTPHREAGETYVGTLEAWDEDGFVLDAGERVRVPADELGLGPGDPSQIRQRLGLVQHVPLTFVAGDEETPPRLADAERDRLYDWTRGTGRVNVNSATRAEVRATVNRAGHAQDIVTVERLGLLEQSISCREGTDPPGILASIGQYLPAELLCVVP
jgi:hypothetical protein